MRSGNATDAARRAGYAEKSARVAGSRNKKAFADEIEKRYEEKAMSAAEAIARVADIARTDLGPYMNDDGEIDIGLLKDANLTHLIQTVKRNVRSGVSQNGAGWETVHTEIKTYSAFDALKTLMQHLGLLKDFVEHDVSDEFADATERLMGRLAGIAARAETTTDDSGDSAE